MRKTLLLILSTVLQLMLQAQPLPFYHLNTANGLTSNQVTSASLDKDGMMWIGTPEGLNSWDGNRVTQYRKSQYPAMGNNDISTVFCDSRNRLWMGSYFEAFYLDENRVFHPMVHDSGRLFGAMILETKPYGILISANFGHCYFDEKMNTWKQLKWSQDSLFKVGWRENVPMGNDRFIHTGSQGRVRVIDFAKKDIILRANVNEFVVSACPLNDNEIMLADSRSTLHQINLQSGRVVKTHFVKVNYHGSAVNARISTIRKIKNNLLLIGTQGMGLLLFDAATGSFTHFTHNPLDRRSIADDYTRPLYADSAGNILVGTNAGISYSNVLHYAASYKEYFSNEKKEAYSGPIHCIEESDNGTYWLGGNDRLIQWKKEQNKVSFFYFDAFSETNSPNLIVSCLAVDSLKRVWVGTRGGGIRILNNEGEILHSLQYRPDKKKSTYPTNFISQIRQEGTKMWVSTRLGVFLTDLISLKTDSLHTLPGFKNAPLSHVHLTYRDRAGNVYLGADQKGLYRYGVNGNDSFYACGKQVINYFFRGTAEDNYGNVLFFGTRSVDIFDRSGNVSAFTNKKELRDERTQCGLSDISGKIWFANNTHLGVYNSRLKQFQFFGDAYGIPLSGFEEGAVMQANNGNYFFGARKGLVYFDPEKLHKRNLDIPVLIYSIRLSDTLITHTRLPIQLSYNNSLVEFNFGAVDIFGSSNIAYQYRLKGGENAWSPSFSQPSLRFAALAPGSYAFELRASRNGLTWHYLKAPVLIKVSPPFWRTTWFVLACITLFLIAFYFWQRFRESSIYKKEQEKNRVQQQMTELEVKALRSQMNPHFIFNSLNAISMLVAGKQNEMGLQYLSKFSKLLRMVLDESENNFTPLKDEIKMLDLYLQLESLRFGKSFFYTITMDEGMDEDDMLIPSFIIQPVVENSVWHGLLHKDGERRLIIHFSSTGSQCIQCVIKDNGIGIEAGMAMKEQRLNGNIQKPKGLQMLRERLLLLQSQFGVQTSLTMEDLKDNSGLVSGTKVTIEMPFK